jgi:hypothetical protein
VTLYLTTSFPTKSTHHAIARQHQSGLEQAQGAASPVGVVVPGGSAGQRGRVLRPNSGQENRIASIDVETLMYVFRWVWIRNCVLLFLFFVIVLVARFNVYW